MRARWNAAGHATGARPEWLVLTGAVATVVLLLVVGGVASGINRLEQREDAVDRLEETMNALRALDAATSRYAQLAAVSLDLRWEERYREVLPTVDQRIERARSLAPLVGARESALRLQAANRTMTQTERRAFELVREQRPQEALQLLSSEPYLQQNARFVGALDELATASRTYLRQSHGIVGRRVFWAQLLSVLLLVGLLALWGVVLARLRDYLAQRDRAEARLQQSERRFRALIEHGYDILTLLDAEGVIRYESGSIEHVLGYAPDALVGRRALELIHPEDAAAVASRLREIGRDSGRALSLQYRFRHGDGSWRWLESTGRSALHDPAVGGVVITSRDITERKSLEARLEEQHGFLRAIVESTPNGIFVKDARGRFTLANAAMAHFYHLAPAEMLGRTDADLGLAPEQVEHFRSVDRRVLETGEAVLTPAEPVPVPATGSVRWFTTRKVPLDLANGERQVLGITTDVTQLKEAETRELELVRLQSAREHAEAAQRRVEGILESITDAFFAVDENWLITYANGRAEALSARSAEDVVGQSLWELYPPAPDSPFWTEYHRAVEEQVPVEFEGYIRALDVWVDVHGYPYEEGLAVFLRDMTERKRAEEALHRTERLVRETQRIAQLGSWEWTPETGEVLWSAESYRIWGYVPETTVPTYDTFLGGVHPDDRAPVQAALARALQTRDGFRLDFRIVRPDGQLRHVHARGHVRTAAEGRPDRVVGFVQNITERKKAEVELREAKDAAERASRGKSELLSRTRHELRTPLNAILGFGQLLELELEREDGQESVQQILHAGRHLLELIDDVLDIARAESGHLAVSCEAVDAAELVTQVFSLVRPLAEQKRVALSWKAAPGRAARVLADPVHLTEVLLDVIGNAIQYNGHGGEVEVECVQTSGERVRIGVRDTGPGIPEEMLPRLFTPFDRAGAERTSADGVGLGLAVSQALAGAMDGWIEVQSTPGQGSTFWIELPNARGASAPPAEDGARQEDPARAEACRPAVLYVEDAPANVRLLERVFAVQRPGIELLVAPEGAQGLELARTRRPDLILLDLNLPDLSGEDVLRALREDPDTRDIPVFMLSGDVNPEQIERLRQLGAAEYLTKPFDLAHFLTLVDSAISAPDTART